MLINDFHDNKYKFLSNFYIKKIKFIGLTYYNAEAAFQAQKCVDDAARDRYTKMRKPSMAKSEGKKEPNLPADWDIKAPDIMLDVLRAKFSDPALKQKLLDTGEDYLEEGNNWHDNKWGKCYCGNCDTSTAQNLLGKLLMHVRSELKESE